MISRCVFSVQRDLMILKTIVYLQAQLFLHRCHDLHLWSGQSIVHG